MDLKVEKGLKTQIVDGIGRATFEEGVEVDVKRFEITSLRVKVIYQPVSEDELITQGILSEGNVGRSESAKQHVKCTWAIECGTIALKLRATRSPAHPPLNDSSCPPGHNTPVPLRRSAPASFKRLLGGAASPFYTHQPSRGNIVAELAPRCEHEDHTEHDRLVGAIGQKLY